MPSNAVDIIAPASNGMSAPMRKEREWKVEMGSLGTLIGARSLKKHLSRQSQLECYP